MPLLERDIQGEGVAMMLARLARWLARFIQKTKAQVKYKTVKSLKGEKRERGDAHRAKASLINQI